MPLVRILFSHHNLNIESAYLILIILRNNTRTMMVSLVVSPVCLCVSCAVANCWLRAMVLKTISGLSIMYPCKFYEMIVIAEKPSVTSEYRGEPQDHPLIVIACPISAGFLAVAIRPAQMMFSSTSCRNI